MNLLQFELKKLIFNKRFIFIFIILFLAIISLFFRNYMMQSQIENDRADEIASYVQEGQRAIRQFQATLNQDTEDLQTKEKLVKMNEMVEILYQLRSSFTQRDWQNELKYENDFFEKLLAYKDQGGEYSVLRTHILYKQQLNTSLLQQHLAPEHATYSIALPLFFKQVSELLLNGGFILLFVLLIGDIITSEFENRSIQFLYTQPIKKTALFHSKFTTAFLICAITILFSIFTSVSIALIFGEQGTFSYPVIISVDNTFINLTTKNYLLQIWLMGLGFSLFFILFYFFISLLTKHTIVSILSTCILLLLGYSALLLIPNTITHYINPFTYSFPTPYLEQVGDSWYKNFISMGGCSVLLYFLCLKSINKVRIS